MKNSEHLPFPDKDPISSRSIKRGAISDIPSADLLRQKKYRTLLPNLPEEQKNKFSLALSPLLTKKGAMLWLYTKNDAFDGLMPAEVIVNGEPDRVMQVIRDEIDDDIPYY